MLFCCANCKGFHQPGFRDPVAITVILLFGTISSLFNVNSKK